MFGHQKSRMKVTHWINLSNFLVLSFFKITDLNYENVWQANNTNADESVQPKTSSLPRNESQTLAELEREVAAETETDPLEIKGPIDHLIELSVVPSDNLKLKEEAFNPFLFLTEIHKETEYEMLCKGLLNLKAIINSRTESLREMVKENFNKFVTARNTVNAIKDNAVSARCMEQLNEIQASIQTVLQLANELSGPLAESKSKHLQIQKSIDLLHEFEPFLSANTRIKQLYAIQNYEELTQAYLSCKSFYSSMKKSKIVDNLWSAVERTTDSIRMAIIKDLKGGKFSSKISKIPTILMYRLF